MDEQHQTGHRVRVARHLPLGRRQQVDDVADQRQRQRGRPQPEPGDDVLRHLARLRWWSERAFGK